jgi:putative peptidoglycan lipid II flippase
LDLTTTEKLLLAAAGSLGVAAFVAVPVVAVSRRGFRLRPRLARHDPAVSRVLRLSGWTVLQHAGEGALLGAAIILGNAVAGGVVAYQVAFVFFLAPYAVLAQPIHTAILPELSKDARDDPDAFMASVRWGLDSMATLVVPCAAALVVFALPAMHIVAFGRADTAGGVALLAAALASLSLGLYAYGSFFLLSGAFYALGDSRTPAITGLWCAAAGIGLMGILVPLTHGAARVAALGFGHTAAYALASLALAARLRRRTSRPVTPRALPRVTVVVTALALAAWAAERALAPTGRAATAAVLFVLLAVAGGLYAIGLRLVGVWRPGVEAVAGP